MIKTISIFIVLALFNPNVLYSSITLEKNMTAEDFNHIEIQILEYGIYKADETQKGTKKEGGYAKNIVLQKKTKKIPAEIGIYWGIKFVLNGLPDGEDVVVHFTLDHPPYDNPLFGEEWTGTKKYPWKIKAGKVEYVLQYFDLKEELITGQWTFYFHYNGVLSNKVTFEVY